VLESPLGIATALIANFKKRPKMQGMCMDKFKVLYLRLLDLIRVAERNGRLT